MHQRRILRIAKPHSPQPTKLATCYAAQRMDSYWRQVGESCFSKLLRKMKLKVPDESILDKRNRSHHGQQGRRVLSVVVGSNGRDEPGIYIAALAAAGLDYRQQTLDESTARCGLRAE